MNDNPTLTSSVVDSSVITSERTNLLRREEEGKHEVSGHHHRKANPSDTKESRWRHFSFRLLSVVLTRLVNQQPHHLMTGHNDGSKEDEMSVDLDGPIREWNPASSPSTSFGTSLFVFCVVISQCEGILVASRLKLIGMD
ncbi:hypothetical protein BLNAU_20945 [Blattamonas nauphoetae]|uniref:Uncharacterized protein n=1 Tax=Blattamonas nauphoetae TaxID=2049346 RepID=A0ABQ9WXR8_9EUKA|nr:hypothetical protein BLNAU_20945 [Blattamonas nauphoetae]